VIVITKRDIYIYTTIKATQSHVFNSRCQWPPFWISSKCRYYVADASIFIKFAKCRPDVETYTRVETKSSIIWWREEILGETPSQMSNIFGQLLISSGFWCEVLVASHY